MNPPQRQEISLSVIPEDYAKPPGMSTGRQGLAPGTRKPDDDGLADIETGQGRDDADSYPDVFHVHPTTLNGPDTSPTFSIDLGTHLPGLDTNNGALSQHVLDVPSSSTVVTPEPFVKVTRHVACVGTISILGRDATGNRLLRLPMFSS